jgi:hypothetical protein
MRCDDVINGLAQIRRASRADRCVGLHRPRKAARCLVVAALLCLVTTAAQANGRVPGATGLAIHPLDQRQLLVGLTYGLALSRDGGASWTWMCEEQIEGNGGDVDPSITMTSDGSLVVLSLTNGGVLVSRDDGCSFERAMSALEGNNGVDLTLDASHPGRVLALMSTIVAEVERRPRYRNLLAHSLDHGTSWTVLAELPADMAPETVEVAASDANRIYVSGTASADPLQGIVERSDDGGLSWTRSTVQLPRGSGSLFISGIHPTDPDRVWFRVPGRGDVNGVLPARLWLSRDGAASFDQVADTKAGMLGFAVSPDGDRVAFGGPADGLFVAPSDGSAAPSKVSGVRVNCLRWVSGGLYVCAGEPIDPYSLGYAVEPTQAIVPLWHRSNTCRGTCAASSRFEPTCRAPWEAVAPFIGAASAMCDTSSPMEDASIDAGSGASGPSVDGDDATLPDASPETPDAAEPARTRSASGCSVTVRAGLDRPWWLGAMLLLAGWMQRRRPGLAARGLPLAASGT